MSSSSSSLLSSSSSSSLLLLVVLQVTASFIFAREGTLLEFIGDEVMAIWNAPATQPDHIYRAVRQVGNLLPRCIVLPTTTTSQRRARTRAHPAHSASVIARTHTRSCACTPRMRTQTTRARTSRVLPLLRTRLMRVRACVCWGGWVGGWVVAVIVVVVARAVYVQALCIVEAFQDLADAPLKAKRRLGGVDFPTVRPASAAAAAAASAIAAALMRSLANAVIDESYTDCCVSAPAFLLLPLSVASAA
jgi:class 3 adenylate cyclase